MGALGGTPGLGGSAPIGLVVPLFAAARVVGPGGSGILSPLPTQADIDGDGWPDLVVRLGTNDGEGPYEFGVALNDKLGGFRAAIEAPFDCFGGTVAFGDLNGDGRSDVVVACSTIPLSETVMVSLARSEGTLSPPNVVLADDAQTFGRHVAVGDLNGDGRMDLVTAHAVLSADEQGYQIERRLGDGLGAFGAPQTIMVKAAGQCLRMTIRDLDGDGRGDVLIEGINDTVLVPALANGSLGSGKAYPLTAPVATADVNGDGRVDLVGRSSTSLEVLLGRASGFVSGGSYQICQWGGGLAVGDLNNDGRPDIACNEDHVRVYPNLGNLRFGAPLELAGVGTVSSIADWDRDGDMDLLADGGSVVFFNEANGLPMLSGTARWPEGEWFRKGDLDGDGTTDVVASDTLKTLTFLGRADGTWGSAAPPLDIASFGAPGLGDLNGDGRPDLAFPYREPSGRIGIALNDGNGRFGAQTFHSTGPYASAAEVKDLNGDGKHDLVVQIAGGVSVLLNGGQGRFPRSIEHELGDVRSMAVADLDGDGAPEIVTVGPAGVFVLRNQGRGTFSPQAQQVPGGPVLALTDLDGDGRPDLAVGGLELTVYRNLGNGTFGSALPMGGRATDVRAHPIDPSAVIAGDLNGDGRTDLVAVHGDFRTAREIRTYFSDGRGGLWRGAVYAVSPSRSDLAFGDLNGDGRPDLTLPNH